MMGDKKWQVAGAAAGVAAATALAGGLLKAASAEGAVNKLSAQLGLTKEESAKAGKIAGELYANNYGDSMEDVTEATGAVMSSIKGMSTAGEADVVSLTGKLMSLASAMDIDVTRAAQVAGQMVTTGLAKDGTEAADLLTLALQKVPAAVREDILDATDEYGPFFAQLGIGGESAMQMLVNSSEKGMFGIDKVGDALKEFTIRSTDMSKASGEAYTAIGLSQDEMTADLLAGGDKAEVAFAKITMGLADIKDPAAQSQAALALFGTPLEDLGVHEIPKFIDSLLNLGSEGFGTVAGAAEEMDKTLNGGAGAALKTFQRTAEQTLSDLGATILPVLTPILQNLSEWAPVIGPLVLALAGFAGAMWAVSAGMAAFATAKKIIDIIKAWTVVQWLLNTAMSANVIGLIVIGVAALIAAIVLLVMNWDTVVAFLATTWQGFVDWFMGVMDGFLSWWDGVWQGFLGFVSDSFRNIKTAAVLIWTGIVDWIKGIPGWILNAVMPLALLYLKFGAWILSVKNAAVQKFTDMVNWVKGIPGMILNGLISLALLYIQFGSWINSVKDAAINKFFELIGWVAGLPGRILGALGGLGSLLWNAGDQIIQGFLNGLKSGFEAVKGFVGGIGQWIADHKGPKAYDLALLVPAGGWIMDGLDKGIQASMPSLLSTLGDVSWMIANGIDPQVTGSGSYAFSGIDASSAGTSAGNAPTVTAVLSDEDRALLREAADRPINASVKVGQRDFALAVQEADKFANRR